MATMTATAIHVGLGCTRFCDEFTGPLFMQMSGGKYDECAVLPIPERIDDWRDEHRTARKRADRAERRGYRFREIRRERHVDDIHAINLSAAERQGRPMSAGYHTRPTDVPLPDYPCARHAVRTYGVQDDRQLVAYLYLYRAGDLALVSQILGHADHLENEIMYLLVQGVIDAESQTVPGGVLTYNRWDSGGDGLRWFKSRIGMEPRQVEWLP